MISIIEKENKLHMYYIPKPKNIHMPSHIAGTYSSMLLTDKFRMLQSTPIEVEDGLVTVYNFPTNSLKEFIHDVYLHATFVEKFFYYSRSSVVTFREFFVPEFVYMVTLAAEKRYIFKMKAQSVIESIYNATWFKGTEYEVPCLTDTSELVKHINPKFKPTAVQQEFITSVYSQMKTRMRLKGYLVALEPGMGKSKLSLFLGTSLRKKHFVIIAPFSTVRNVWENEVKETFIHPKKIWTVYDNINDIAKDTEVLIVNYEAVPKVTNAIIKNFDPKDTIIIIDECHNYKDIKSKRTTDLLALTDNFACDDILPMSGTPIKAFRAESVPIFRILDPYFTPDVQDVLMKIRGNQSFLNELLKNRLGMIMYRKLKADYLDLPEKVEKDLKISIPNGNKYTLEEVKKQAQAYKKERMAYYRKHYREYEEIYNNCLAIHEKTLKTDADKIAYREYKNDVAIIKTMGVSKLTSENIERANTYEKERIIPSLPLNMRKRFRDCKTVIKYIELKVNGEVLGTCIGKLRAEMTTALIGEQVRRIINEAEKKTILFSSYVDTLKIAEQKCKEWRMKPMVITGENSKEASKLLEKFKADLDMNPLIASLSVMSTGHTINEANTVIFLNVPFRSVDYEQASDRCYRIGQDTTVYIYKLILDTGNEPNLSTRMHDIVAWSKEQFDEIVGNDSDLIDAGFIAGFTPTTIEDIEDKISSILKLFKF